MADAGPAPAAPARVEHSWEAVREDASGRLIPTETVDDRSRSRLAKMNRATRSVRRGLIRYTVLAIDASASLSEKDMKPSRGAVVKECAENFIHQYFDQNPISQLSVVTTADRTAHRLTDLSGNPKHHVQALGSALSHPRGAPSLQSVLIMANGILCHIPDYGHRELLLVFGALSTCDAGDIYETIEVQCCARRNILCIAYVCCR
jgi:transcription initiation factor TFIIH subunit 2